MVRADRGATTEDLSSAVLMFWAVLAALSLVTAIIFSCAGGASKEKASATHADTYGSTCGAGCGAGCGGWAILFFSNQHQRERVSYNWHFTCHQFNCSLPTIFEQIEYQGILPNPQTMPFTLVEMIHLFIVVNTKREVILRIEAVSLDFLGKVFNKTACYAYYN